MISFGSDKVIRNYSWSNLKIALAVKGIPILYDEDTTSYTIYGYDGPEVLLATIWISNVPNGILVGGYSQAQNDSDKSDFETNYKPTANRNIVQALTVKDHNNKGIRSTPFQELRTSNPFLMADLVNKYDLDPRLYETAVATGGTVAHQATNSSLRCTVTGSSGSSATLRTNDYYRYQAGHATLVKISIAMSDAGQANQTREWGFYEDNDGLFFQLSGTSLSLVERSSVSGSVVNTQINQSAWNIDKLDGFGVSAVTYDASKAHIYEIEFQWFGVGLTRWFIDGILVHEISHFNVLAVPYMRTAQLPVQVKITNTGSSSSASIELICSSVTTESGQPPFSYSYGVSNAQAVEVGATERPILSIRPKATYNSITNRMWIVPTTFTVRSAVSSNTVFKLIMNGSLTGSSFSSVATNSGTERDFSATSVSGGDTLYVGLLGQSNNLENIDLNALFAYHGRHLRQSGMATTLDTLTITAMNQAAGNVDVSSAITWNEFR